MAKKIDIRKVKDKIKQKQKEQEKRRKSGKVGGCC